MTALQRYRLRARLTRAQLAERADVSAVSIWRHETGEGAVNDVSLFKLAAALGVGADELRGDDAPTRAAV